MSAHPMSDAEYAARQGNACPYCHESGTLEGRGSVDFNGTEATVEIDCTACGAEIIDVYRLAGYTAHPDSV